MKALIWWLEKYYDIQEEIALVYRPDEESKWGNRCFYLGEGYNPNTAYNHRRILRNEVVIEFDNPDKKENLRLAQGVSKELKEIGVDHAIWFSGNKSYHVHCLLDMGAATNTAGVKRCFMRHVCKEALPDLQLAGDNHLIRAEWGVHEKTGKKKELIYRMQNYPRVSRIPPRVWVEYYQERRQAAFNAVSSNVKIKEHPGFKFILESAEFKESDDGRKRALYLLTNVLKEDYREKKEELVKLLQDWYRYTGGRGLTDREVAQTVNYQWDKPYRISERYLNEFLESIGRGDLVRKVNKESPPESFWDNP